MIKLCLFDIDGTLTNGGYYVSSLPDAPVDYYLREFNTRDFVGIKLLHDAGIRVAVVTGSREASPNQFTRAAPYMDVFAGLRDKYEFIKSTFVNTSSTGNYAPHAKLSWDEIAFIGDEINDAQLLQSVGLAACPADAVTEVRKIVECHPNGFVMTQVGGRGCVREFTDMIRVMQNIPLSWGNWTDKGDAE